MPCSALAEGFIVQTYTVIISIDFSKGDFKSVFAQEDFEGTPLPRPGQKNELYTFRIIGVPTKYQSRDIADSLLIQLSGLKGPAGVDYSIAYNIPWEMLRDGSIVSTEGDLTADEVMEILDISNYTLKGVTGKGKLPVSRIPQRVGGPRPIRINRADLDYFIAHRKGRGRHPKKEN